MLAESIRRCAPFHFGWGLLAALLTFGCRSSEHRPGLALIDSRASAAFEEARTWRRAGDPRSRDLAVAAATRASEIAPDWVAPRRFLDELRRDDWLGIDALAEHRVALARNPDDPRELYLAGRLEGARGAERLLRAARLAPRLAWSAHGLGFLAAERRDFATALRHAERALELARDPWERSYFTSTLARYLVASDQPKRALAALERRLDDPELAPVDFIELSAQTAAIELSLYFQPEHRRGWERALSLLRDHDLTEDEIRDLFERLRLFRGVDESSLALQLALAARPGVLRDRLRAELMLEQRPTSLALGLLRRAAREGGLEANVGPLMRAARFAAGQFALGVEEWLADLPSAVLDADGSPREARLRAVAEAAREVGPTSQADALAQLGETTLAAGWFSETRSVASTLAVQDLERALDLEERAAAGQALLYDLRRTLQSSESGSAESGLGARAPGESRVRDLTGLLAAYAPLVARADRWLGGESDPERIAATLTSSPLLEYASFGAVVHPGPSFSAADELAGLGRAGEAVPGLAALFDRLGRFGVFGQVLGGGGPDGTILQRVLVEQRSGQRLGVPWSGTVAWCEGTDLKSRAGRAGADISGAALHEGYWLDIDSLRREREPWARAARALASESGRARMERALATRGLALVQPLERRDQRHAERRDTTMLLGESERVRLAVLRDRARERGYEAVLVDLDELIEVTAMHEEGHLCDRTRFMPLSRHLLRSLAFVVGAGMTPGGIARRLEYRAQLVALCEARDPRVPLVAVLRAGEDSRIGVTPHAEAYRELLVDLVAELDRSLALAPRRWPELDPNFVLVHQLHLLGPERVRAIARALARGEGLFQR